MVGAPPWRLQHESEVLTLSRATGALSITQALTILLSGRFIIKNPYTVVQHTFLHEPLSCISDSP